MKENEVQKINNLPGAEIDIRHFPSDLKILSSLIHSVPLSIYAKDIDGIFIFTNRHYCQNVGKVPSDILGKTDYDIHPREHADKYLADDRIIMESQKTRSIEEAWQSIGGENRYVQVVKAPMFDNDHPGKVLGTIGVFWDITEKKTAENLVREERTFLRNLIDSIPALIYAKDTESRFILANKEIASFMGANSPDELIGKNDFDYYDKDIAKLFQDVERNVVADGIPVSGLVEQFTHHGRTVSINTSKKPLRDSNNKIIGTIGVGHDITNIKEIETRLRESEERYAAVVNQAIEGIYLLDPFTKTILESNHSFQQMLGYTQEELYNLSVYDFVIHDHNEVDSVIDNVLKKKEFAIGDRKYRVKNGGLIDVEVSAKLIDFGGKKAILIIVRNTSEKREAEKEKEVLKDQLRRAQKFEAIGTLAGGVAHDLNNILSGIVGYPELLLNMLPKDSDLRPTLSAIHDSGKRAATVVADLLTIARAAATTREVQDLNKIVTEYLESPEFKKTQLEYPDIIYEQFLNVNLPTILCSPVHVKKCLMNLIVNAAEAIRDTGKITIRTLSQRIESKKAEFPDLESGDYVILEIHDTGSGISKKDLDHIFDPFYSQKVMGRSGTGLGLTVVWNTVIDHGGTIKVESSDQGTSFKLFFPLCATNDDRVGETEKSEKQLKKSDRKEHILVVDDEPLLRDIASQMLQMMGFTVNSVSSGEAAVEYVQNVQNAQVDLLLLDMLMEPGMNGRQTYEKIIQITPGVKTVIASGYSDHEDVREALRLGANGFIQKPYSMEKLSKTVNKAFREDSQVSHQ